MSWQGQNIKILAREKNLTLTGVAEQVGVSRQALNDWAKGKTPRGGHLLRLCKTLGVTPDVFFASENEARISVPMHRTRKRAKLSDSMQKEAKDLASSYELFFREASDPGLVKTLRIYNKTEEEVLKAATALRKLGGAENDAPMTFRQVFSLAGELGVNIIFSDFHKNIKAYAFYTKINGHRVVFVNFETKILDLVFALLHESVHSIRDESDVYEGGQTYDKEEEDFCDRVASLAQLTEDYFSWVVETLQGLRSSVQLRQLALFAKQYNHTLHAVNTRIGGKVHNFGDELYKIETNLRKASPTVREFFFNAKDSRNYVDCWKKVSPVFFGHVVEQCDKLSPRRLCELLAIETELDAIDVKNELVRVQTEG